MRRLSITTLLLCLLLAGTALPVGACDTLTYATFNIRYANGDRGTKHDWSLRRDTVARFVQQAKIDVCGMQEVLHEQLLDLQERMPEYAFVGVGRDDGDTRGEYSPVAYRRDRWEALQSGTFWLSPTPDSIGSRGWDAALPRIASWVLLRDKHSGRELMCINTHFDHVGHQARIESGKLILQKVREIAGQLPMVLTGDFNVNMADAVYDSIMHDDAYPVLDTHTQGAPHEGANYTYHGFGKRKVMQCDKIDFVFTSTDITTLGTYIPMEDRSHPATMMSDHNPIVVRMAY